MEDKDQLESLEGIEQMAYVAAHEDVAKKYNETVNKNKQAKVKSITPVKPSKTQELEGVEDMAYVAAHKEEQTEYNKKPAKKSVVSKIRDYITNIKTKENSSKDDPTL